MKKRSGWVLLIFLLSGLVLGSLIGELTKDISWLWWLNYGQNFGLENPLILDLSVIKLTFGLMIKINVCGILGMLPAFFLYRKV